MAPRGRKPKPDALKDLEGNPGKRSRSKPEDRVDAALGSELPPCPDHLDDTARAEWARIIDVLASSRMLTPADVAALAAYCAAYGRWADAETQLRELGPVVKSPKGYPIQNPYLSIANKALQQMMKILPEFGLTPSSRARMPAAEADDDGDDLGFQL